MGLADPNEIVFSQSTLPQLRFRSADSLALENTASPNLGKSKAGNTKGGSITVQLTSCLTGLDWSVLQIKT
jgi:hypothetical protein